MRESVLLVLVLLCGLLYDSLGQEQANGLFPTVFNLASQAEITVNATCGQEKEEMYCRLVEHVRRRPMNRVQCGVCNENSSREYERHPVTNAIDGSNNWWQSPTIANGRKYHWVTITLDLKQIYQVAYVILKAANSPRPGNWILERSLDGVEYMPWQYYAISDSECWNTYGIKPTIGQPRYRRDDEVICTPYYSRLDPLQNGEIHTSLVNGRPGVIDGSDILREFTSARFIRLRLQRIRTLNADLMTFITNREQDIDQSVTRRYYYSIKDISVGGQCICFGHARACPRDVYTKRLKCVCEHNTCGDSCERCCPMFNQKPWQKGQVGQLGDYACEECNCNGHASECVYNQTVNDKRQSLNIQGKYEGGGVCMGCRDNTEGINCEKCKDGYYNPVGLPFTRRDACRQCRCDNLGSTGVCVKDDSMLSKGLNPGDCICREGFAGRNCDRCADGYKSFPLCEPCPCSRAGSTNEDTCVGQCVCKANVVGAHCDQCRPGYYNLDKANPEGCSPCFCFGASSDCASSSWGKDQVTDMRGWSVTNGDGSQLIMPTSDNGQLLFDHNDALSNRLDHPYYWLAPRDYLGNKLTSYGGELTYLFQYGIGPTRADLPDGQYLAGSDIILQGNGMKVTHSGQYYRESQTNTVTVKLVEDGWRHLTSRNSVSKKEFMTVLHNLQKLMIRASYHTGQLQTELVRVELEMVSEESTSEEVLSSVEQCRCPPGYSGTSCQLCDAGYRRVDNVLYGGECRLCDCNRHAASCDPFTGVCEECNHNTTGLHCESCQQGFYGDARRGTPEDCLHCACPLTVASNNFATSCVVAPPSPENHSGFVCLDCPFGYEGKHCESCGDGYFGNPLVPGNYCQPCLCNGNLDAQAVGNCDSVSGECLKCVAHTEGWNCENCQEGYYGTAKNMDCSACACNLYGSLSPSCNKTSGQCSCKPGYIGRDCGRCEEGYGNIAAGCVECNCDRTGSLSARCDPVSGQCVCKPGIGGLTCDQCQDGFFNYTRNGCSWCGCDLNGSNTTTCDQLTGQCTCKPNVVGRMCEDCAPYHYGMESGDGCEACGCNSVGSLSPHCNLTSGQCQCKPGVNGRNCGECEVGYYGFSFYGCQECPRCAAPGQVCDPLTGACVCPPNTIGRACEACAVNSWGYDAYKGCKKCECNATGSADLQCGADDGICTCKEGFEGDKCDMCRFSFYGFPSCYPCNCNEAGTTPGSCDEQGSCQCNAEGQCPCKENVNGQKCRSCKAGTFSLQEDNAKGCTECFCFGRSSNCRQANMKWSQLVLSERSLTHSSNATTVLSIDTHNTPVIPVGVDSVSINTLDTTKPLYWSLPKEFVGERTTSYNGKLKFTIYYDNIEHSYSGSSSFSGGNEGSGSAPSFSTLGGIARYPLVQLIGDGYIHLDYHSDLPLMEDTDNSFEVLLTEDDWVDHYNPEVPVTRKRLMVALQKLESILVRATEDSEIEYARLVNVSLDVAVPAEGAPVDAFGVEQCVCPPQFEGLSCQDPADGYYRKPKKPDNSGKDGGDIIDEIKLCDCNRYSYICDRETGVCSNCRYNTAGDHCERCADGYYGNTTLGNRDACQPCACPLVDEANNFSPTCAQQGDGYVCLNCSEGHTGPHCEQCAPGYYGNPLIPGDKCKLCDCNPEGATSQECDRLSGQCTCYRGIIGRRCDECMDRFAVYGGTCKSCDEGCTAELMESTDALLAMQIHTNFSGIKIALPYKRMRDLYNSSRVLRDRLTNTRLQELEPIKKLIAEAEMDTEDLEREASELAKKAQDAAGQGAQANSTAYALLEDILDTDALTRNAIGKLLDVLDSRHSNVTGGLNLTAAIIEAEAILKEMKARDFENQDLDSDDERRLSEMLKRSVGHLLTNTNNVTRVRSHLEKVQKKLAELTNSSQASMEESQQAEDSVKAAKQLLAQTNAHFAELTAKADDVRKTLNEAAAINENSSFTLWNESRGNFEASLAMRQDLTEAIHDVMVKGGLLEQNLESNRKRVADAHAHADELLRQADSLEGDFADTRHATANALRAANAYRDIVAAIDEADSAAGNATYAANNAFDLASSSGNGSLLDQVEKSRIKSTQLEREAERLEDRTQDMKDRIGKMKDDVDQVDRDLKMVDDKVDHTHRDLDDLSTRSNATLEDALQTARGAVEKAKEVDQKVDRILSDIDNVLEPRIEDLERASSATLGNVTDEINKALSNAPEIDRLVNILDTSKEDIKEKESQLAKNLMALKDNIMLARRQANSIKVSLNNGGKCLRNYRPEVEPGASNTITLNFKTNTTNQNMVLFYLQSTRAVDYMALDMVGDRVRFLWNAGGGTKIITHSLPIEKAGTKIQEDDKWYKVSAQRFSTTGRLSVLPSKTTTEDTLEVTGESVPGFIRMDVDTNSDLFLGGVPEDYALPADLSSRVFQGCIGDIRIDGEPVGMYNFKNLTDSDCTGCVEAPSPVTAAASTYQFDGTGFAEMEPLQSKFRSGKGLALFFEFKTVWKDAVLFFVANENNGDFYSIEIQGGKVVFKYNLGRGATATISTVNTYNTNQWVRVKAKQRGREGRLEIGDEVVSGQAPRGGDDSLDIGNSILYFAGLAPHLKPDRRFEVTRTSFAGCLRDIQVSSRSTSSQDLAKGNFVGMEKGCRMRTARGVGFEGDGFVELPGQDLEKDAEFSFSFRSLQTNALLLLGKGKNGVNYYSMSLVDGHVVAKFSAAAGPVVIRSAKMYNDGRVHTVSVVKNRRSFTIIINDEEAGSDKMGKGSTRITSRGSSGGLFLGGVSPSFIIKDEAASAVPLRGCLRDLVINGRLMYLDTPLRFENADIGRCQADKLFPDLDPVEPGNGTFTRPTSEPRPATTPSTPSVLTTSLPPTTGPVSTLPPESCAAEGIFSQEPHAVSFGDIKSSHSQIVIKNRLVNRDFNVTTSFRTYYPLGLIFYVANKVQSDYIALQLTDGILKILYNDRGVPQTIASQGGLNDGEWHTLRVMKDKKSISLQVDNGPKTEGRIPRKLDVQAPVYVGGLPSSFTPMFGLSPESFKGCMRNFTLNEERVDLANNKAIMGVGPCFRVVEPGVYFPGMGYAIYNERFRVGSTLLVTLEFRTSKLDGVIFTVSSPRGAPALALELHDGKLRFSANNRDGVFTAEYNGGFRLCDNRWHTIEAEIIKNVVRLRVDGGDNEIGIDAGSSQVLATDHPFFIGGFPKYARPQGAVTRRVAFEGCMRNMVVGGNKVDWYNSVQLVDVHISACPVSD